MPAGVYSLQNRINGKVYVGKSVTLAARWRKHCRQLRSGQHENPHLQRAWTKYGESAFEFKILQVVEDLSLLAGLEAHFIQVLDALNPDKGYNLNEVLLSGGHRASAETRAKQSASQTARHAAHPWKATPEQKARMSTAQLARKAKASPETRAKMSTAATGKAKSLEHRARIIAAHTGWVPSPETRAKIGKAHLGLKHSPETRAKMSAARTGTKRSPETRARMVAAQKARFQREREAQCPPL